MRGSPKRGAPLRAQTLPGLQSTRLVKEWPRDRTIPQSAQTQPGLDRASSRRSDWFLSSESGDHFTIYRTNRRSPSPQGLAIAGLSIVGGLSIMGGLSIVVCLFWPRVYALQQGKGAP